MPLPCTPASMSELDDHSQSHSMTESNSESEQDLITPRPGPSDPDKRTDAVLSTPLPTTAFGSWSSRKEQFRYPTTSEDEQEDEEQFPSKLPPGYRPPLPRASSSSPSDAQKFKGKVTAATSIGNGCTPVTASSLASKDKKTDAATRVSPNRIYAAASTTSEKKDDTQDAQQFHFTAFITTTALNRSSQSGGSSEGSSKRPRIKKSFSTQTARRHSPGQGSSPRHLTPPADSDQPSATASATSLALPERTRSITFSPSQSLRPSSDIGYSAYNMSRRRGESPVISPGAVNDLRDDRDVESSADENTAIFRRTNPSNRTDTGTTSALGYGAIMTATPPHSITHEEDLRSRGYEGAAEDNTLGIRDLSPIERRRKSAAKKGGSNTSSQPPPEEGGQQEPEGWGGWLKTTFERYGSVELENSTLR